MESHHQEAGDDGDGQRPTLSALEAEALEAWADDLAEAEADGPQGPDASEFKLIDYEEAERVLDTLEADAGETSMDKELEKTLPRKMRRKIMRNITAKARAEKKRRESGRRDPKSDKRLDIMEVFSAPRAEKLAAARGLKCQSYDLLNGYDIRKRTVREKIKQELREKPLQDL